MNSSQSTRNKKIAWKLNRQDFNIASIRYRMAYPAYLLRNEYEHILIQGYNRNLINEINAIIFVKTYTEYDLQLAQAAKDCGVNIILDLCDNIFIENYGLKSNTNVHDNKTRIFLQMAKISNIIVTPTNSLGEIVRLNAEGDYTIKVIPDVVESESLRVEAYKNFLKLLNKNPEYFSRKLRSKLIRLLRFSKSFFQNPFAKIQDFKANMINFAIIIYNKPILNRMRNIMLRLMNMQQKLSLQDMKIANSNCRSLIWYGHHGADYASFGMLDLLLIKSDLERISNKYDVELVIVSNNYPKYINYIEPINIPKRYVEWTHDSLRDELCKAYIALIPNSLDSFSICKSPNRAVLALYNSVAVVATLTPALTEMSSVIKTDNFFDGMDFYLSNECNRKADIIAARKLLALKFGPSVVTRLWKINL